MEGSSVNEELSIESKSSCYSKVDDNLSTDTTQQQQQQRIEPPEKLQTVAQDVINDTNNNNNTKRLDESEVIRKICPLMKHQSNTSIYNNSKVVYGQKFQLKKINFNQASSSSASETDQTCLISSMAAVSRLIGAKKANSKYAKKPLLRQVDIVGQLNHSANKGFLLITMDLIMIFTILLSILLLGFSSKPAQSVVWPFNKSQNQTNISPLNFVNSLSSSSSSNRTNASSKRFSRNSGPSNQMSGQSSDDTIQQPPPPPISQQYHYFWNHDQIEPNLVASEASKILAEAQIQTDQLNLPKTNVRRADSQPIFVESELSLTPPSETLNKKVNNIGSDSLSSSASSQQPQVASPDQTGAQMPMVIPPAIQQQLTSMVLTMLRQQQMSLMMQPRFDSSIPVASRRFIQAQPAQTAQAPISPFNPLNRFWMSASSQHPVIAPPPPHMLNPLVGAESMPANHLVNPYSQQQMMADAAARGTASVNMGGVPVYGPFMVAPSTNFNHPHQQMFNPAMFMANPSKHSSQSSNHGHSSQPSSGSGRLASSLLSRRKSWPLFNFGQHLAERGSLFASASQLKPTISLPPNQQQKQRAAINTATLPPESMALLDAASNQLANAILSQVQARAAEQKLASAFAQVMQEQKASQDMQSLDSTPARATINLPIGQKSEMFQPPYMVTGLNPPSSVVYNPIGQQFAYNSNNQMLKQYPFDLVQSGNVSLAFDSVPFGSRLKRRHLNTLAKSTLGSPTIKHVHITMPSNINHGGSNDESMNFNDVSSNKISNPPYTVLNSEKEKIWSDLADDNGQQYEDVSGKQAQQNFKNFHNSDIYETLASSVSATPTRVLAPQQQQQQLLNVGKSVKSNKPQSQQQKRIVKKDASSLVNIKKSTKNTNDIKQQQQSENSHTNESNLRHLFMLMATESPVSKQSEALINFDSVEQTQLRRLKRSATFTAVSGIQAKNSVEKPKILPENEFNLRRRESRSLLKSSSSSSWVSIASSASDNLKHLDKQQAVDMANATNQSPKIQTNTYSSTSQWKPQTLATKWAAKVEPSATSRWIGGGSKQEDIDSSLLKRQAELSDQYQSAFSSKSVAVANPEVKPANFLNETSENITSEVQQQKQPSKPSHQEPRQSKFLKIKRVTASASVLHHPTSSKLLEKSKLPRQSSHQTRTVLSGSPVQLIAEKFTQEKMEDSSKGDDPMSSSLSESARVANYFQNVDNDKPESESSQTSRQSSQQSAQVSPSTQQSIQPPQINLAYSSPAKVTVVSKQNDNVQPTNHLPDQDIKRQQQQPLQQQASDYSGNKVSASSGIYSSSFSPTYTDRPTQGLMSSSSLVQVRPRNTNTFQVQQPQQQNQFQVSANNADISSAATAGNLAYVKSFPQQSSSNMNQQARQGIIGLPGGPMQANFNGNSINSKLSAQGNGQTNSFGLSRSLIGNLLTNFDGAMQRSSSSINSVVGPIFDATSHSRQTVMTPSGKSVGGQQVGQQSSYPDRTTSADQSNNYNEGILPPQSSSSTPSQSSSHSSMFGNAGMSNIDIPGPVTNQQSDLQQFDSSLSSNNQQQQQQNDMNSQNMGFNDNNFAQTSKGLESSDTDSARFNQHQQDAQIFGGGGASPFNQTDSYVPDTPDSSSLYNSGSIFGNAPGQNSFNTNPQTQMLSQTGDSSLILNQANQNQLAPIQNQFYSQQRLNAFGAAVADYNQQKRFNQQFQDAAIGNFNSRTKAAMFPMASHNLQQHNNYESPSQRQSINNYQQLPHSSVYSNLPVDEDAAAGTLAAAGIPTYPTPAQLLAMQTYQVPINDFNGMLMAASNKREQDDGEPSQKTSKKNKGSKQGVSHHYHFNNLANPFEDPEGFAPISPLEIVGNGQYGFQAVNKQKKVNKNKEADKDKEEQGVEEEKPKKKGFLRRFSLKNLFKRFRKDKKKEIEGEQEKEKENSGNDAGSDR